MLVRDQDGVERLHLLADGFQAADQSFEAQAGIHQDACAIGRQQRAIAGAAAGQHAEFDDCVASLNQSAYQDSFTAPRASPNLRFEQIWRIEKVAHSPTPGLNPHLAFDTRSSKWLPRSWHAAVRIAESHSP
jgi:hypothetical protein